VLVEDLHWVDVETQTLLDRLADVLPDGAILLIVSYRPDPALLWRDRPSSVRVPLDPLPAGSANELAQFETSEAVDTVRPALVANGGWFAAISTPLGIGNAFHQLYTMARESDDWWVDAKTYRDTRYLDGRPMIAQADIDRELKNGQRVEWIAQEYECRFVTGLASSIFGDLLNKAEQEGRILDLPQRTDRPTLVGLDLGVRDKSVAVFIQPHGEFLDIVDCWAGEALALPGVIQEIRARGWSLVTWLAPHDLAQRDFSASGAGGTAVTRDTVARRLGVVFRIAPRLSIAEGLDAVRRMFSRFRFDRKAARRCWRRSRGIGAPGIPSAACSARNPCMIGLPIIAMRSAPSRSRIASPRRTATERGRPVPARSCRRRHLAPRPPRRWRCDGRSDRMHDWTHTTEGGVNVMTMEPEHPDAMAPPLSPTEQLETLVPRLRREAEAVDPDTQKLAEVRRLLDGDLRRLEAAAEQAPAVAARYSAGFARDASLLADLAREPRPGVHTLVEQAQLLASGALAQCTAGPGQLRRLLDRVRHLTAADLHHAVVANLVAKLRAQARSLAGFPQAVPAMRGRLDHALEQIRARLMDAAAPATPLETLPPRPAPRPTRAKASLHEEG
jgi:hypothetical protein